MSLIVPNLIMYEGSAFVIDPKGENAAITAGRRGKGTKKGGAGLGQDVYVLDPFGVSGVGDETLASFNPLAELDLRDEDVVEDAGMFADALIEHPQQADRHWTECAQALLRALILLALADPNPARRNLVTVRRLLMLTDRSIDERIKDEKMRHPPSLQPPEMTRQQALLALLRERKGKRHGDICLGVAGQFEDMHDKELGSVLSTAKTQTQWLDDRR